MTAMEIAGKRHRAKGVERREKVPTESIPRTPFPSARIFMGYSWIFHGLGPAGVFQPTPFHPFKNTTGFPSIQAFLTEIISSGYMGTVGLRFQGTQNLAHNTDPARLRTHSACAKVFELHTRFGRESQIFWLKFLRSWRPEKPANGLCEVTPGHWEKEVAGSSDCPGFVAT